MLLRFPLSSRPVVKPAAVQLEMTTAVCFKAMAGRVGEMP
jgi:hypothetical protein